MRPLLAFPGEPEELLTRLPAALDGTGPGLLPLPADHAARERVIEVCRPDLPLERDDVALVVPTSGSSGEPKGVLLTASALRASAAATLERLGGPGQWLCALPVTHVAGVQVLVRSVLAGIEPVVVGRRTLADAAKDLREGRRYVAVVPTQLRRALADPAETAALASFDAVLLGGAATPPALLATARCAGVPVVTTYGMTETSGGCVYDGIPLGATRVVLDGEGGQVRRIRLGGPTLAVGYRLRPDLTADAFHDGWFTTSDLGRWDGPRLQVLGRVDDLVVTGGEKVAPTAVEAALVEHPAVADVCVLGVPDAEWGSRIVAVVVLRQPLAIEQAREHVTSRVSRVAAPRELVAVAKLPVLASGKVDRLAVRRLVEERDG